MATAVAKKVKKISSVPALKDTNPALEKISKNKGFTVLQFNPQLHNIICGRTTKTLLMPYTIFAIKTYQRGQNRILADLRVWFSIKQIKSNWKDAQWPRLSNVGYGSVCFGSILDGMKFSSHEDIVNKIPWLFWSSKFESAKDRIDLDRWLKYTKENDLDAIIRYCTYAPISHMTDYTLNGNIRRGLKFVQEKAIL